MGHGSLQMALNLVLVMHVVACARFSGKPEQPGTLAMQQSQSAGVPVMYVISPFRESSLRVQKRTGNKMQKAVGGRKQIEAF